MLEYDAMLKNRLLKAFSQYETVVLATFLAVIAFLIYLAVAGHMRTMITSEPLYDLRFIANSSFSEGVADFYVERVQARFLHGVFVAVLYSLFGFNPAAFYFVIAALLASAATAIVLLLKPFVKNGWIAGLLVVTLSLLPTLVPILVNVKKLHHALAWALFWWSCVLLYKWLASRQTAWLLGATLLFVGAWLSYEAIAFLLPVPVLLFGFDRSKPRRFIANFAITVWITFLAFSASGWLAGHYQLENQRNVMLGLADLLFVPVKVISGTFAYLASGDLAGPFGGTSIVLVAARLLIAGLVVFGVAIVAIELIRLGSRKKKQAQDLTLGLAAAGLWLVFVTYVPFALVGQPPNEDSLVGLGYGIIFLLVALMNWLQAYKLQVLSMAVLVLGCAGLIFSGGIHYSQAIASYRVSDQDFVNFVRSLKEQVPDVQTNTTFVLVNMNWGRTGCLGYMEMLYPRKNVRCIHLFDNDIEETYSYTTQGQMIEDNGSIFPPGFIILQADEDGSARVIDSITELGYPSLPVEWLASMPIETSFDRIIPIAYSPSSFYEYVSSLP